MLTTCKTNLSATEKCQETAVIQGYCYDHFKLRNKVVNSRDMRNRMQDAVNADVLERLTRLEDTVLRLINVMEMMNERYG